MTKKQRWAAMQEGYTIAHRGLTENPDCLAALVKAALEAAECKGFDKAMQSAAKNPEEVPWRLWRPGGVYYNRP